MAPEWALYPLVVLATLATVIASQALISGAFSLTQQAVQLGYCPRVQIRHTSETEIGQIYVSSVNWLLMRRASGWCSGSATRRNLAGAYGVAVTTTMVLTTGLFYVVARDRFRWRPWLLVPLTAALLAIDLALLRGVDVQGRRGGLVPAGHGGRHLHSPRHLAHRAAARPGAARRAPDPERPLDAGVRRRSGRPPPRAGARRQRLPVRHAGRHASHPPRHAPAQRLAARGRARRVRPDGAPSAASRRRSGSSMPTSAKGSTRSWCATGSWRNPTSPRPWPRASPSASDSTWND